MKETVSISLRVHLSASLLALAACGDDTSSDDGDESSSGSMTAADDDDDDDDSMTADDDGSSSVTADDTSSTEPADSSSSDGGPTDPDDSSSADGTSSDDGSSSSAGDDSSSSSGESGTTTDEESSSDGGMMDVCGDGIVGATEACDDANDVDLDGCDNACQFGDVVLGGTAPQEIASALDALGEVYSLPGLEYPGAGSGGVLIIAHDGAGITIEDYQSHLDAGGHILMIGGSGLPEYRDWVNNFVSSTADSFWHMSDLCTDDWTTIADHPITALLPDTYEFDNQATSYHMMHFLDAGQPEGTEVLAQTCDAAADNKLLVTRRYDGGGTFTYMANDLGPYPGMTTQADFTAPFLEGYLNYVRSPAAVAAACGNGIVDGGEACDDGNATDLDACDNACQFGGITVAGNATSELTSALDAIGEVYDYEAVEWPAAQSTGVLVIGQDGAIVPLEDYQGHLDAGGHILVVGGSGGSDYRDWVNLFVSSTAAADWHTSDACSPDWTTIADHPITALLPATYEFDNVSTSFHMLHFLDAGQPAGTESLGETCDAGVDNDLLVTRRYDSGGTFTYMATDLGPYPGVTTEAEFIAPFFTGYLEYVRAPAP